MDEVGGRGPAAGSGGGHGRIGVRVRAPSGQFPNQLGDASGFGAGRDPVGGSGAEGEPVGLRPADDDVVDHILELAEQRIGGVAEVGRRGRRGRGEAGGVGAQGRNQ